MADLQIRKDFVDGMEEVFTTLFNEGVEDGIYYYPLSENTTSNVYGESKSKVYKSPILLVASAHVTPVHGEEDIESIKGDASFTVPLKSLQNNNLSVTREDIDKMCRGVIQFHNVFYEIDNINPSTYVEDIFLFYKFQCSELLGVKDVIVEEVIPNE